MLSLDDEQTAYAHRVGKTTTGPHASPQIAEGGQRVLAPQEEAMSDKPHVPDTDAVKQAAQEAADRAKDVVAGVKEVAAYAADTGRAYARDAMNAASKNIDATRTKVNQAADYLALSIKADPIKAVLFAAAISALLAGLLVAVMGNNRR